MTSHLSAPSLQRPQTYIPLTKEQVRRYNLPVRPAIMSFDGEAYQINNWLEVPLGDGWVAAYRLTHEGPVAKRRTKILEVRVFPDEPDRPVGEWSALVFGEDAQPARRPFSFQRVRRGLTERMFNTALQATVSNASQTDGLPTALGHPGNRHGASVHEGQGAGRPGRPKADYARFALRYHAIEHSPRREPGQSTRKLLAREWKVPVSTVGKRLSTARKLGFLTEVVRGGRRSMATNLARQVATPQVKARSATTVPSITGSFEDAVRAMLKTPPAKAKKKAAKKR